MSNLEQAPRPTTTGGRRDPGSGSGRHWVTGRDVPLGRHTVVRRFLPHRERRTVGAWCFLDHFGPEDLGGRPGMRVPPHPHTGLQTVSWLVEGEILHRDSLGNQQTVRPGQLNVMTSGRGISHSEESPPGRPPVLHGVQLWIALPRSARHDEPRFEHLPVLPVLEDAGLTATVLVGEMAGARSPARVHSPLVGVEVSLAAGGVGRLPLERGFEHAVLVLEGDVLVDDGVTGEEADGGPDDSPAAMLYLGRGRTDLLLRARTAGRLLLLGGEPFEESLVMWWNFVGRTHEDIAIARADWAAGRRFGQVLGYDGGSLPAPPLPATRLRARPSYDGR